MSLFLTYTILVDCDPTSIHAKEKTKFHWSRFRNSVSSSSSNNIAKDDWGLRNPFRLILGQVWIWFVANKPDSDKLLVEFRIWFKTCKRQRWIQGKNIVKGKKKKIGSSVAPDWAVEWQVIYFSGKLFISLGLNGSAVQPAICANALLGSRETIRLMPTWGPGQSRENGKTLVISKCCEFRNILKSLTWPDFSEKDCTSPKVEITWVVWRKIGNSFWRVIVRGREREREKERGNLFKTHKNPLLRQMMIICPTLPACRSEHQ